MMNIEQDAVLAAILLLVPVLIFLVLSGKLLEINAGGVSAKFNDAAQMRLFSKDDANAMPVEEEKVAIIMKQGLAQLHEMLRSVGNSRYIVLTVTLNKGKYDGSELLVYLKALSQHPNFTFLAILEPNGTLFGYLPVRQATQIIEFEEEIIEYEEKMKRRNQHTFGLVEAVNEGSKKQLLSYGLIEETAKPSDTNITALKLMTKLNMSVLIMESDDHMIRGVIEREQVLSKLILALTK